MLYLFVTAAVLGGLIVSAPWIIGATPLRNVLLQASVGDELDASVDELSCGWLSPLRLGGLRVQRKDGESEEGKYDLLKEHVKEQIGKWKYPREIVFVVSLPKTATGKIQRFKLRDGSA